MILSKISDNENLKYPKTERYQLALTMDYLFNESDNRVCALYGLRRTGKTTIIIQAINKLLKRGINPENILYITGEKEQFEDIDCLYQELDKFASRREDCGQLYVFIDEISWFRGFIGWSPRLYDYYVRIKNMKVVIAGTNLVSLYVAGLDSLYDRLYHINTHHLTFYEHCKFVLNTELPSMNDFCRYLQVGGLFSEVDTRRYMRTAIVEHLSDTLLTGEPREMLRWISEQLSDTVDWEALINNICLYSAANINERNATTFRGFRTDSAYIRTANDSAMIDSNVINECVKFLKLDNVRFINIKRNEIIGLLDFLVSCGFIVLLKNRVKSTDGNASKMYLSFPFMRFSFTRQLAEFAGLDWELDETINTAKGSELMGELLEGCFVSEYLLAKGNHIVRFWRENVGNTIAECDFMDISEHKAYELKWKSGAQYNGFYHLLRAHEDWGFTKDNCHLLKGESAMNFIYSLGEGLYSGMDTERSVFC